MVSGYSHHLEQYCLSKNFPEFFPRKYYKQKLSTIGKEEKDKSIHTSIKVFRSRIGLILAKVHMSLAELLL